MVLQEAEAGTTPHPVHALRVGREKRDGEIMNTFGMSKHRTSGVAVSGKKFTGKKSGKKVHRKSRKTEQHKPHVNKYAVPD
jgi:hypothetical protein